MGKDGPYKVSGIEGLRPDGVSGGIVSPGGTALSLGAPWGEGDPPWRVGEGGLLYVSLGYL